jgi:hypothetical protein
MASLCGEDTYRVHVESHNHRNGQFEDYQSMGAEFCMSDAFQVSKQLDLFMKTCVLPLAMQTRALIFATGSNDCVLASSLERQMALFPCLQRKSCSMLLLA